MNNPETQVTFGTRHRIKTYKTTKTQYGKLTLKQRDPSKIIQGVDLRAAKQFLLLLSKRYRIPKWQSKMDNTDTLTTWGTQDEEKRNQNTTQYVLDTTMRKQAQLT